MSGPGPSPVLGVDVVRECKRAQVMLHPGRLAILEELAEPGSAAGLARRLDLPRQRVNYHLGELAAQRLVELVGERRQGSAVERLYRRTGRSYAISPAALGRLGTVADEVQDRFSAAYQIALAAQAVRDLGDLQAGATAAGQRLPTFAMEAEVRFANAAARSRFVEELTAAVADLVRKHHDDRAPRGRTFRFYLGGHPKVK